MVAGFGWVKCQILVSPQNAVGGISGSLFPLDLGIKENLVPSLQLSFSQPLMYFLWKV